MTTLDEGLDAETVEDRRRSEWLDSAQELLDWLDEHRDLIPTGGLSIQMYGWTPEEFSGLVRSIGSGQKVENDYTIGVERRFGVHDVGVRSVRSVSCEAVDTGDVETKNVEVADGDEVPEGAVLVEARTVRVYEVESPVLGWKCPPSLLSVVARLHKAGS